MRVLVAGGGIAGAEALLALHDLAGTRVTLTLVSPSTELVIPPLAVAEPFALGHAEEVPIGELVEEAKAELRLGALQAIDDDARQLQLRDGTTLAYDALMIATGARAVARVEHATTWWPAGDQETFLGMLRDIEEGYAKRLAFVIPEGAVWPLPLYELALLSARQISGMGIDDIELIVITPEEEPLQMFGSDAAAALRDELVAAGIQLETGSVARIEKRAALEIELAPSGRRLPAERIIALPAVEGPAIPGTAQDDRGFIKTTPSGRMLGSESVWAVGDVTSSPVKFGGLATRQADAAAIEIASLAGAQVGERAAERDLQAVLMTGRAPRALGGDRGGGGAGGDQGDSATPEPGRPPWLPAEKVSGAYLTPFLRARRRAGPER